MIVREPDDLGLELLAVMVCILLLVCGVSFVLAYAVARWLWSRDWEHEDER